jgi:N-sulfoglucosamine sulfohydrolase
VDEKAQGNGGLMKRLVVAAIALWVTFGVYSDAHGAKNVVLYVTDDQGSTDAGCYGNPVIKTPGLDTLAAAGTRFTHGFCTTPSCSASRSVILTGVLNHANGQYGHAHSYHHFKTFDKIKSLPNRLRDAGYRTISIGKYHVAPVEQYDFEYWAKDFMDGKGRTPRQLAVAADNFLRAEDDRPFFMYFCTTEPHRPFRREDAEPVHPKDVIVPSFLPDNAATRNELAQYYSSVEQADMGLVALIASLKETGHWDDTLIIYLSDNGIAFPGAKTNLYEPGMRLPCVVRNPALPQQGTVTDAMVTWADVTPTILDYTGVEADPKAFHGRSFLGVLDQPSPEGWDSIFASHTFHEITMYYPMRVLRDRQYKLIWNLAHGLSFPFASDLWASETWQHLVITDATHFAKRPIENYLHRPAFELYDLEADPDELNNLAEDPEHAELLAEMQARLKAEQERTGDPWILKWEHE